MDSVRGHRLGGLYMGTGVARLYYEIRVEGLYKRTGDWFTL